MLSGFAFQINIQVIHLLNAPNHKIQEHSTHLFNQMKCPIRRKQGNGEIMLMNHPTRWDVKS